MGDTVTKEAMPEEDQKDKKEEEGKLNSESKKEDEKEKEEKEECGWCKWMKAGGCKDEFEVWLKCIDKLHDEGRHDVESCADIMGPLFECMEKNAEYYSPQLDALKADKPPKEGDEGPPEAGEAGASKS